ncbi:hypothetical protein CKALI_11205 [Corynebacterium kalinowskii]|uniref:Uncharacterized protein n=1 Tax=Corynebacterium kalinowskii TaxID=2675216 RepID=A0A6B8VVX6_9CORY|nr:hypothetical protein [Corynebacterium kalinowskii]QGU03085.1 hypothetical protein CKALI_11205 [Corynebacterium kalinowskii]
MSIYESLANALNVDIESEQAMLALDQLNIDTVMLEQLISERKRLFPSLSEFAKTVGMDEESIETFEVDPLDFSLAFVRLYALGVRAKIEHNVIIQSNQWHVAGGTNGVPPSDFGINRSTEPRIKQDMGLLLEKKVRQRFRNTPSTNTFRITERAA